MTPVATIQTGYISGKGYGQFWHNGKAHWAHRISCAIHKGDVPGEMTVNHTCRNCRCVNPEHLEFMSNSENTADGNRNRNREEVEIPF